MVTARLEPATAAPEAPGCMPYRMSAEESFRAVETGVFAPGRRVAPDDRCVWPETPILIDDFNAPLPDAAVVRGSVHDEIGRRSVPKVEEIGLVSDATLRRDQTSRLRAYAGAGIGSSWVVNLVSRRVEVYPRPVAEGETWRYESSESYGTGELVPLSVVGRESGRVATSDLLPEEDA